MKNVEGSWINVGLWKVMEHNYLFTSEGVVGTNNMYSRVGIGWGLFVIILP